MTKHSYVALTFLAIAGLWGAQARAGDPGELFPNVTYDQAVDTPRLEPKSDSYVAPHPAPATHTPAPATHPPAAGGSAPPAAEKPKPEAPATPAAVPQRTAYFWSPYRANLLMPIISADLKAKFDDQFGTALTNAKTTDDKKQMEAALIAAAAPDKPLEDALRRYLILQALSVSVELREPMATHEDLIKQVQPLLENDHTLPATEVRANLLDMAAQSAAPSGKLLDMLVDAFNDLTIDQVQTGYPVQADGSLRKARQWLSRIARPTANRTVQVYYAQYWVTRAHSAMTIAQCLKATLSARPADPASNTMLASLQLSLFGDLANAAPAAAKSNVPSFQAFAKLVAPLDLTTISADGASDAATSLDICGKLLDAATDCSDSFDRYAIATFALSHLSTLSRNRAMDDDQRTSARTLQRKAQQLISRNGPSIPRAVALELMQENMMNAGDSNNPDNPTPPVTPVFPGRRRGG